MTWLIPLLNRARLNTSAVSLCNGTLGVILPKAAQRLYSTHSDNKAWFAHGKIMISNGSSKTPSAFHAFWLRDHCRCPECFHQITKQRLLDTVNVPSDIAPKEMTLSPDGNTVRINWTHGDHVSEYPLEWLREHSYDPPVRTQTALNRPKHLWGSELGHKLPTVCFEEVMKGEKGLGKWLELIDVYGIAFVDGVPASEEGTRTVTERIAFIRESHYGTLWSFTNDLEHGDTAYTDLALPAHTDTTYFTDPVGLQLFHVIEFEGTGGDSLYVDGFQVAQQLKETAPEHYDTLSRIPIPTHSAGDKSVLVTPSVSRGVPILNHDPLTGELRQIRFNNDDRSVLDGRYIETPEDIPRFYSALKEWTRLLRKKQNEFWIPLRPGRVAVVNNWRVLHGRGSYRAKRRVCGAYVGMDDFKSRLQTVTLCAKAKEIDL
ncbi:trimethyllysine dioxygenase [Cladochytrium replicatum]|nr:trimethyllysine dioxygenase [Cladochytrium replicatum]